MDSNSQGKSTNPLISSYGNGVRHSQLPEDSRSDDPPPSYNETINNSIFQLSQTSNISSLDSNGMNHHNAQNQSPLTDTLATERKKSEEVAGEPVITSQPEPISKFSGETAVITNQPMSTSDIPYPTYVTTDSSCCCCLDHSCDCRGCYYPGVFNYWHHHDHGNGCCCDGSCDCCDCGDCCGGCDCSGGCDGCDCGDCGRCCGDCIGGCSGADCAGC